MSVRTASPNPWVDLVNQLRSAGPDEDFILQNGVSFRTLLQDPATKQQYIQQLTPYAPDAAALIERFINAPKEHGHKEGLAIKAIDSARVYLEFRDPKTGVLRQMDVTNDFFRCYKRSELATSIVKEIVM